MARCAGERCTKTDRLPDFEAVGGTSHKNPRKTVSGGVTTSTIWDREATSAPEEGKMAWMSGKTGSIAPEGVRDIDVALELLAVVDMLMLG